MKRATYKGRTEYHGNDGDKPISLQRGESAIVSDEKAAQLEADFPDDFKIADVDDTSEGKAEGKAKREGKGKGKSDNAGGTSDDDGDDGKSGSQP